MCRDPIYSFSTYIFAILSGGGKKGVAIRPYPSPGPPPFIPNAFIKCGTLTGSDSCWAVSQTKEIELGEEFLLAKKKLRPIQNHSRAKKPNTNQMPSGICTAKRRLWVDGDVQLYIRFVKATPSQNGVRLHLTFQRLATLVGIGHEIATP